MHARPGFLVLIGVLGLAGCASPGPIATQRSPAQIRAQLQGMLPPATPDRAGWAADFQSAFAALDLQPTTSHLCAAVAVTQQESGLVADPAVSGLPQIARGEIDRRAARLHIPQIVVRTALRLKSPDGRSYEARLQSARTERELSAIYEDLIGEVPMGRRLFAGANPVHTGGPMQVSVDFAERESRARPYPYTGDGSIRHAVFTRRGGLYFGVAHLLDYPVSYDRMRYRFADYNAGRYASRNAAFQAAVTAASGLPLALDGDLVLQGRDRVGATESAVRTLAPRLDMDVTAIRSALERGHSLTFEDTELYGRVFALAERRAGQPLARAILPRITLDSPKISRTLTTEWFATRVDARYRQCLGSDLE